MTSPTEAATPTLPITLQSPGLRRPSLLRKAFSLVDL